MLSISCSALRTGNVMEILKEAVVFLIGHELERVLVVGEKSVVTISKISESAALYECKVII